MFDWIRTALKEKQEVIDPYQQFARFRFGMPAAERSSGKL
jgi:hypothetical protein